MNDVRGACCAQLARENFELRQVVEKERQRRRYVLTAYKKLLTAYQAVVDVREAFDSSAISHPFDGAEERTSANFPSVADANPITKPPSIYQPTDATHQQQQQQSSTAVPVELGGKSAGRTKPVASKAAPQQSSSHVVLATSVTSPPKPPHHLPPHWYFVALDPNALSESYLSASERRLHTLLRRSEARRLRIAETSQRRAQIAANRRAVALDLLKGRRMLDEEALTVLHTDSSRLSAFPAAVMRQWREASRRRSRCFERRLQAERGGGNTRAKQLEMATNQILAHSAATIAKCTIGQQHNASFKSSTIRRLTRSLSSLSLTGGEGGGGGGGVNGRETEGDGGRRMSGNGSGHCSPKWKKNKNGSKTAAAGSNGAMIATTSGRNRLER